MYICYSYFDYRKEFNIRIHKLFFGESDAIAYAESLTDENDENDSVCEKYVDHGGDYYDAKESNSTYYRVAVDYVKMYDGQPDHNVDTMYVVYRYTDYRKGISVKFLGAFDIMEKSLEFAAELCDGKESSAEYVCHGGTLFDQKEIDDNYGRVAVDEVPVEDEEDEVD